MSDRRRRQWPWVALVVSSLVVGTCAVRRWRSGHGLAEQTLTHGGQARSFFVHLPPGHDRTRAVPLVLALHGGGGSARDFDSGLGSAVADEADRRGWVVVFPDGIDRGWNDGRSIVTGRDASRSGVDDVGFLSAVIDRARDEWGIDERRIYAVGISNGGFMAERLAIDRSERIAAIAAVVASLPKVLEHKAPSRPVSVMLVNGTEDPLVPYDGGQVRVLGRDRGEVLSTEATVAWWATHDHCPAAGTWYDLPDAEPSDATTVRRLEHAPCDEGSAVVLYRVAGGGHTWPGGKQYLPAGVIGVVSRDFDATRVIFDFFAEHAR